VSTDGERPDDDGARREGSASDERHLGGDSERSERSEPTERDALSRLVELLAEERIIQPSLADFLR
jgi:hypothetical protein